MSTSRSLDAVLGSPIPAKRWMLRRILSCSRSKSTSSQRSANASFGLRPQKMRTVTIARSWPVRIDKPPRLVQRERIDFALRLAQVLHEDHRVFGDQFTAFRDREDRPQARNHHVDAPRSDQLGVVFFTDQAPTEKTIDVAVVDLA